ncbi:MAG: tripartite tricarboxylate transporter TctB family protein [Betaproteobacteria bacterium]|nr:tripartite tricarboxylate transporter TctB family protein [Betaproteobacteria bacterium]MCC7215176.1 tripartite tricarboxylate transporter TctB family protein [Burkholderiales bacterium]
MSFIRNPKDFWAGVLFIAFGLAAVIIARDYALGTAGRMGPGYFPRGLGIIMMALGLILSLRALRVDGDRIRFGSFKPIFIVLGSVIVFALAAPKLGLIVATILLIVVSSTASHEFRWKEAVISSLALSAATLVVFVYGLKLQLPTWPWFLQ